MEKNIYWSKGNGIATLNLDEGYISLATDRGHVFEILEAEQVKNGMTLQEIYNEIPEDISNYILGGRS